MKINVIAIGKIKEKYFVDAISEYQKRLTKYADFKIIELPDAPPQKSVEEQKQIESASLLSKAKGFVVAMDLRGKQLSSEQLGECIDKLKVDGVSEISFLIGGSHGHTDELRAKANLLLSFGKATFPHQLFRVMLSEQIYRALTINAGTPYHK